MTKIEAVQLSKLFISEFFSQENWYQEVQSYVEVIVLYGSVAKETNRPDSDIDLLVFLPLEIEMKYT